QQLLRPQLLNLVTCCKACHTRCNVLTALQRSSAVAYIRKSTSKDKRPTLGISCWPAHCLAASLKRTDVARSSSYCFLEISPALQEENTTTPSKQSPPARS